MSEVFLNRIESRMVDEIAIREYGMSGLVLMENAGRNCALEIQNRCTEGSLVKIFCGGGNNGGDGFVIARHLKNMRIPVEVILLKSESAIQGDAKANLNILRKTSVPVIVAEKPGTVEINDWVRRTTSRHNVFVDCMLGTGATGDPRFPFDQVIDAINQADENAFRFAVDIPSGLHCDSGMPGKPTFRAEETLTFVTPKVGFQNADAKGYLGRVKVLDIGIPRDEVLGAILLKRQR